jgi:hypothetical protein
MECVCVCVCVCVHTQGHTQMQSSIQLYIISPIERQLFQNNISINFHHFPFIFNAICGMFQVLICT